MYCIEYIMKLIRSDVFLKQEAIDYLHKHTYKIYLEFAKTKNIQELKEMVKLKFPEKLSKYTIMEIDRYNKLNFPLGKLHRVPTEYIIAEICEDSVFRNNKFETNVRAFLGFKEIINTISTNSDIGLLFDDAIPIDYLGQINTPIPSTKDNFIVHLTTTKAIFDKNEIKLDEKTIRLIRKNIEVLYNKYTFTELKSTNYSNPYTYIENLTKRVSSYDGPKNYKNMSLFIVNLDLIAEKIKDNWNLACLELNKYVLADINNYIFKLYI